MPVVAEEGWLSVTVGCGGRCGVREDGSGGGASSGPTATDEGRCKLFYRIRYCVINETN